MIEYEEVLQREDGLMKNLELLQTCFPDSSHFTKDYLQWLYCDNPDGQAVGYDAWDGDTLAAHYVCIPTMARIDSEVSKILLSLNTATHPEYRGKGLFIKLAEKTYEKGESLGFYGIHGIANANSTPGFIKKLGFQLVGQLNARIGLGSLGVSSVNDDTPPRFERIWTRESVSWRCRNPNNAVSVQKKNDQIRFFAATSNKYISVFAQFGSSFAQDIEEKVHKPLSPLRLFLGIEPKQTGKLKTYFNIPQKLRPSPLNLIFRSFNSPDMKLEREHVRFSFLDFDAY